MPEFDIKPGQRIRICQAIDRREGDWEQSVEGEVIEAGPQPTGSWFAHGKDDKLWLNRVRLRKDNGEVTTISIDRHTRCELLSSGEQAASQ